MNVIYRRQTKKKISERESLLDLNRIALDYFRSRLLQGGAGEKARAYLAQRGIIRDVIDDFQLGYVPAGWDNLVCYFSKRGVNRSLAERSGLIVESQKYKGRFYDRFRDRIIFPIFNISQQLIGFGGRVLDDSLPKYLNSP
jgi:DNA primase